MSPEPPKDLPVRPAAEAQTNNASEATAAPPKDANAKSKQAPSPDTLPEVMTERNKLFEELWQQYLEETKTRPHPEINVTLDIGDGNPPSSVPAKAFETTPGSFLRDVPKDLSANIVIAKVDGELWDLNRPLEKDCSVLLVPFSNPEAREVFWHSSAHTLGEACECEYKSLLSHGPPTPQGFFYDMAMPDGYVILSPTIHNCVNANICGKTDGLSRRPTGSRLKIRRRVSSRRSKASTDWTFPRRTSRRCSHTANTNCTILTSLSLARAAPSTVAVPLSISAEDLTFRTPAK